MSKRYAIIENGIVTNVVVADAELAIANGWVECLVGGPGWLYANGVFSSPQPVTPEPTPQPTKEELLAQLLALQEKINAL